MSKIKAVSFVFLLFLYFFCIAVSSFGAGAIIENGEMVIKVQPKPCRVVTMNQASTEIMFALGLEDNLVGTAFLDDVIYPDFAAAYEKIPVLSEKYPSKEVMLEVDPDFVYAGYASAFSTRRGLIDRKDLQSMGIRSYLSPSEMLSKTTHWTFENLYQELHDIGEIFSIEKRADRIIADIQKTVNEINENSTSSGKPKILWLDSVNRASPFVGSGYGVPNEIIRLAGGVNVFADVQGTWASVSKEQILDLVIDFIVLIDANWESAEKKKQILEKDTLYRELDAIKNNRFVHIKYSYSTAGVMVPQAVTQLREAINSFDTKRVAGLE